MTAEANNGEALRQQMEAYIAERLGWLQDAVELATGDRGTPIKDVFQKPMDDAGEARRDYEMRFQLDAGQEAELRGVARRFDIGGEQDVTLDDINLPAGHISFKEGGLFRKMLAEAELESDWGTEVYGGSPYEALKDIEKDLERKVFGDNTAQNQYEAARRIAQSRPGFEPLAEPFVMPFGYDIQNNHALVGKPTGQLTQIGRRAGKPVMLLRVDREPFVNEAGENKYRNQPDTAALMGFIGDVLTACGDTDTAVGYVTSNTYASRNLDAMRAGYKKQRLFGTAMYGRATLARVEGKTGVPEPTEIFQIPGELRVMHDKLHQLDEAIHATAEE